MTCLSLVVQDLSSTTVILNASSAVDNEIENNAELNEDEVAQIAMRIANEVPEELIIDYEEALDNVPLPSKIVGRTIALYRTLFEFGLIYYPFHFTYLFVVFIKVLFDE